MKDYLKKMEGMKIDDIVNSGALIQSQRQEEPAQGNAKQQQIVDNTRTLANNLEKSGQNRKMSKPLKTNLQPKDLVRTKSK